MKDDAQKPAAQQLGAYIKARREERGLGIRELASKAGIDAGGLARIEHGQRVHSPRPMVLNRIASALGVPITDLLTCVGYDTPSDLHDFIRSHYGHLPDQAISAATAYIEQIAAKYDIDPNGPANKEDEIKPPRRGN